MQAQGKANQPAVLIDSTGKSYALQAHTLPSVRGHGEPVTGRLSPPNGAFFSTVLMGSEKQNFLFVSTLGYGFITSLANMVTKNRNGKQLIKLADKVELLSPIALEASVTHLAFTSAKGILTVIEIEECPHMEKGKGARLVHIETKQFQAGKDHVLSCLAIEAKESFTLKSGSKKQSMSPKTWQNYIVSQGEKGTSLPKGFTKNPVLIRQ
jgi:topoisomerase-4 subunit A